MGTIYMPPRKAKPAATEEPIDNQESPNQEEVPELVPSGVNATFKDFFLAPQLARAIDDAGFEKPSEIQEECIPQAVQSSDILCQAKAGMGKTAIFIIAILNQLDLSVPLEKGKVLAVVVAHTRELAFQIESEFKRFGKYMDGLKISLAVGRHKIEEGTFTTVEQTPHILVGTPGRLLALARDEVVDLSGVEYFVVDECDKVLSGEGDKKMLVDVQEIFLKTPKTKQTMFLTATLPEELKAFCRRFLRNPVEVLIDDVKKLTLHGLTQYSIRLQTVDEKITRLKELLSDLHYTQAVVFCGTVNKAKFVHQALVDAGLNAAAVHAQMKQSERFGAFDELKDHKKNILVTTKVMSRGIDLDKVNLVINFDTPTCTDEFLHRVGRAGRFNTKGLAITFVTKEDEEVVAEITDRFGIQLPDAPGTEDIDQSLYV